MSGEETKSRESWREIFPFDPYDNQAKGINDAVDTLRRNGISLIEGPCGTGKTLVSLTAGLELVRDESTDIERILIVTSKKQQMAAFEEDLEAINSETEIQYPGLSLVGKADLCPYVQAGEIEGSEIYHKCINLRDNVHRLMEYAVRSGRAEGQVHAAFGLQYQGEPDQGESHLPVFDSSAPYKDSVPEAYNTEYCPFYASHVTNSIEEQYPLILHGVHTSNRLLYWGSLEGTCPHIEMKRLHDSAPVLIGNYQHVFNPRTVGAMTAPVLDESTLLICDEAHGLVPEVRDQLSVSTSLRTLSRARSNIEEVHQWVTGGGEYRKSSLAQAILKNTPLIPPNLKTSASLLKKFEELLNNAATEAVEKKRPDWRTNLESPHRDPIEAPLQKASEPHPDLITQFVASRGYENVWKKLIQAGKVTSAIKGAIAREVEGKSPDGAYPIGKVVDLFERWYEGSHSDYFRQLKLTPVQRESPRSSDPEWKQAFRVDVEIKNCLPKKEIASTLDLFGGAILMSATLSPLDIYEEVTGVAKLRHGTQPDDGLIAKAKRNTSIDEDDDEPVTQTVAEEATPSLEVGFQDSQKDDSLQERRRRVTQTQLGLRFPTENRASLAVNAPKFTHDSRWPPEDHPSLRSTYRDAIVAVVEKTPGNVLVCMPSYQEAAWASEQLEKDSRVSKPVLTDTSSSNAETTQLREAFISGEPKALTTSLRGTLTEGVDYDGDKLHGVVVCGLPITNTSTPKADAIEAAYDYEFGGDGFDYAFSVPAVRKARQAIGRVIRGVDEVGVRVVVDERYANPSSSFTSVREYFPDYARDEFTPISPDDLAYELQRFWEEHSVG
jgi:DNA excision repair protein ERCC-2